MQSLKAASGALQLNCVFILIAIITSQGKFFSKCFGPCDQQLRY